MKKFFIVLTGLLLLVSFFSGCASSPLVDAGFEEVEKGVYTYLDTQTSPLPEGGIMIDLVQGAEGYVKFTITDLQGTATVDYYQFTPANSTMHRYRYVAAMGMKYNYYFDYTAMALTRVTDADDTDVTESLKNMGRWDSAASETKDHAEKLMAYFKANFKMSIDEAVVK